MQIAILLVAVDAVASCSAAEQTWSHQWSRPENKKTDSVVNGCIRTSGNPMS